MRQPSDPATMMQIMTELQEKKSIQKIFDKELGERVINPTVR